jgi:mycothiol synthase
VAEIRRPDPTDAGAVADILNALGRELYGGADVTELEVSRWWEDPKVEAWVAVEDGRILSYADLGVHHDGTRLWIDLRRGGGGEEELLATAEARASELAKPGAVLRTAAAAPDLVARAIFERNGYRPIRHTFHMSIDVRGDLPAPAWPDGITVRSHVRGEDDERVYEADQEAFEDHWEHVRTPYEEWRFYSLGRHDFDPSLWFLAEEGGEIAGISLCAKHFAGDPGVGRVATLAVRRPWRRRGLGLALLHHSFRELKERGFDEVRLEVDGENLTGAVRLYERAGMHVSRRYDIFEKNPFGQDRALSGGILTSE